jgi:hypothetical protein
MLAILPPTIVSVCLSTGRGSLWGLPLAYSLGAGHDDTRIHYQSICQKS